MGLAVGLGQGDTHRQVWRGEGLEEWEECYEHNFDRVQQKRILVEGHALGGRGHERGNRVGVGVGIGYEDTPRLLLAVVLSERVPSQCQGIGTKRRGR